MLLVGWQEGHPACKKQEWWGAGMVICLEQGADLHMAQLMPLPLTVSCFSKIQIGFSFLVPAHLCSPGKRAVKRVCVMVAPIPSITYELELLMSWHNLPKNWSFIPLLPKLLGGHHFCTKLNKPYEMMPTLLRFFSIFITQLTDFNCPTLIVSSFFLDDSKIVHVSNAYWVMQMMCALLASVLQSFVNVFFSICAVDRMQICHLSSGTLNATHCNVV